LVDQSIVGIETEETHMLEQLLEKVSRVKSVDDVKVVAAESRNALSMSGALVGTTGNMLLVVSEDGLWEIPVSGVVSAVEMPADQMERPVGFEKSVSVSLLVKRGTKITLTREFEVGLDIVAKTRSRGDGCPSPDCNQCSNGGCCCPPKPTCLPRTGCTD
jgi:RNase P/RNase MRP subunit p29